jgi:hypothetical protein
MLRSVLAEGGLPRTLRGPVDDLIVVNIRLWTELCSFLSAQHRMGAPQKGLTLTKRGPWIRFPPAGQRWSGIMRERELYYDE